MIPYQKATASAFLNDADSKCGIHNVKLIFNHFEIYYNMGSFLKVTQNLHDLNRFNFQCIRLKVEIDLCFKM